MDEKELVKRVKNSFKAKKTRAEILQGFQKRGYKLAYAEELIKKAKRPKRLLGILGITILLFFSLTISAYSLFANPEKLELENPLANFQISSNIEKSIQETNETKTIKNTQNTSNDQQSTTYDQIEITSEFITYLLNEVGAYSLHKNPLTLKDPIMNFKIENKEFTSTVTSEIETNEGLDNYPDIIFNIDKKDLIDAILSDDPKSIFVESISSGKTTIEMIASEADLFAKGYLGLYNTLNPN